MSQADIQRFVSDLKGNPELLEGVKSGTVGLGAVVELAQAKGYDITVDEAKAYIRDQAKQDLSDDQLDAVAGGKGPQEPPSPSMPQAIIHVAETAQAQTAVTSSGQAVIVAAGV